MQIRISYFNDSAYHNFVFIYQQKVLIKLCSLLLCVQHCLFSVYSVYMTWIYTLCVHSISFCLLYILYTVYTYIIHTVYSERTPAVCSTLCVSSHLCKYYKIRVHIYSYIITPLFFRTFITELFCSTLFLNFESLDTFTFHIPNIMNFCRTSMIGARILRNHIYFFVFLSVTFLNYTSPFNFYGGAKFMISLTKLNIASKDERKNSNRSGKTSGSNRERTSFNRNEAIRQSRISRALRDELSSIITEVDIKAVIYPDENLLRATSIVDVDISADLSFAKVFISVLGNSVEKRQVFVWLCDNVGQVKYSLAQRLRHMKKVPDIFFKLADNKATAELISVIEEVAPKTGVIDSMEDVDFEEGE